jgi:hypothetical protein
MLRKEKYKTQEGAHKRARFENMLASFEYKRGYKAALYRYFVVTEGDHYRVQRMAVEDKAVPR